jgi:WhiB family redox-sensing transcriptional regulator
MKLRSLAPKWFNDDKDKEARCVAFPATAAYDPWYPENDDQEEAYEDARAICNGTYSGSPCPLLQQCLEFALINNERWGMYGGTTPAERTALRKKKRERDQ